VPLLVWGYRIADAPSSSQEVKTLEGLEGENVSPPCLSSPPFSVESRMRRQRRQIYLDPRTGSKEGRPRKVFTIATTKEQAEGIPSWS